MTLTHTPRVVHTPQAQRALQRLCDVKVAAEVSRTKRRAHQHLSRITDDVAGRFNRLRCRQQPNPMCSPATSPLPPPRSDGTHSTQKGRTRSIPCRCSPSDRISRQPPQVETPNISFDVQTSA